MLKGKKLVQMCMADVAGRKCMVMQAEGEEPVVYDMGARDAPEAYDAFSQDVGLAHALFDRALPDDLVKDADVEGTWTRPASADAS